MERPTTEPIDLEKLNIIIKEKLSKIRAIHEEKAKHILGLENKPEIDIVNDYIREINNRYNELSGVQNGKLLQELKVLEYEINACNRWLNGSVSEDLSFIPDLMHKRMFAGKSKDEIIDALGKRAKDIIFDSTKERALYEASNEYEPLRVRVEAVRLMTDYEIEQKKGIFHRIGKFLRTMGTWVIMPFAILDTLLSLFLIALGTNFNIAFDSTSAVTYQISASLMPIAMLCYAALEKIEKQNYERYQELKNDLIITRLYDDVKDIIEKTSGGKNGF